MPTRFHPGRRLAPTRFLIFLVVAVAGSAALVPVAGTLHGIMGGFDLAAIVFLATLRPLLAASSAAAMRAHARDNGANRAALLGITVAVTLAILVAVGSELAEKGAPRAATVALIVATLALAWTFANTTYALHYAHLFYLPGDGSGDRGGLEFPGTAEPTYWDFIYFGFTLGMTFQTSDVQITSPRVRTVALAHSLAAFVFNLGVVAFTVNVLGGG